MATGHAHIETETGRGKGKELGQTVIRRARDFLQAQDRRALSDSMFEEGGDRRRSRPLDVPLYDAKLHTPDTFSPMRTIPCIDCPDDSESCGSSTAPHDSASYRSRGYTTSRWPMSKTRAVTSTLVLGRSY